MSAWRPWLLLALPLLLGIEARISDDDAHPTGPSLIRGVGPLDVERYKAALRADGFHCLDGQHISVTALNDDYCDCADGSDEPGTAACAGQDLHSNHQQTLFFCKNAGAQSRYLYRSRVNDGVCDCCDGTDEWRTGRCRDNCIEEGRPFHEVEIERQQRWERGTAIQRRLVDSGQKERESWREELEKWRAALPELERESKEKKRALEEAKSRLPSAPAAEVPSTSPPPSPPPAPPLPTQSPMTPEEQLSELTAALDPGLKNERRALAMLKGECKKTRSLEQVSYTLCFFREAFQAPPGTQKDPVSLGRWAGWDFSVDPPRALFRGGAPCPDGTTRKLEVTFACSSKAKLKSVTESEKCLFQAHFLHPGACDASRAPEEGAEESRREGWARVLAEQQELLASFERSQDKWRSEKQAMETALPGPGPEKASPEQPKISEYAKWMEGSSTTTAAPLQTADSPTAPAPEVVQTTTPRPEGESLEQREHREAEEKWAGASTAARDAKHRIWNLEAALHPGLSGGHQALAALMDKCLEKKIEKFTYKFCFFQQVVQDTDSEKGVSLGRWMGWDFSSEAGPRGRFARGAACGNGVRRGLTVSFACGAEAAVNSVNESKVCVYEAEVLHPAACNATSRPPRRELPVLMPKDEL